MREVTCIQYFLLGTVGIGMITGEKICIRRVEDPPEDSARSREDMSLARPLARFFIQSLVCDGYDLVMYI